MHRRAKLTVFGRRLLVERIEQEGWPIAHAAAMTGVSRQTATKWVRRYRAEGLVGLEDRSSRPNRSPRALAREQVAAILAARHELGLGPHRLAPVVGSPRSTISDVLRRHGLSRLRDRDRPSGVPIRYVRERPGELLHIDVKKLGRIPDGGGHRFRGRGNGNPSVTADADRRGGSRLDWLVGPHGYPTLTNLPVESTQTRIEPAPRRCLRELVGRFEKDSRGNVWSQ